MSWLLRGAQSALFYYVSCTPYHNYRHMRQRRAESREANLAREKYEKDTPDVIVYRQPEPMATNPFWAEEIRMGPGPPPKYAKKSAKKLRELERAADQLIEKQVLSTPTTPVVSSQDSASTDEKREGVRHGWNHRFYQREDESLWGITHVPSQITTTSSSSNTPPKTKIRPHTASSIASSTVRAQREALIANTLVSPKPTPTLSNPAPETTYVIPHAPPLNAHHPPVARDPRFSGSICTQWVLQPCPAPCVMAGRRPVEREKKTKKIAGARAAEGKEPGVRSEDTVIQRIVASCGGGSANLADELRIDESTSSRDVSQGSEDTGVRVSAPARVFVLPQTSHF